MDKIFEWLSKQIDYHGLIDGEAYTIVYEILKNRKGFYRGFYNNDNRREVLNVIWTAISQDIICPNKIHKILCESTSFEDKLLGELVITSSPDRNPSSFLASLPDYQIVIIVNKLFAVIIESMDRTKKPKDNIINDDIIKAKNIAKELSEWLCTEEGKQCMSESQKQGQDIIKSMKDARNISAESLQEQVTI